MIISPSKPKPINFQNSKNFSNSTRYYLTKYSHIEYNKIKPFLTNKQC